MEHSGNDSDVFLSAEESFDEDEEESLKKKEKSSKLQEINVNDENINVADENLKDGVRSSDVPNINTESVAYRKRPSRSKNSSNNLFDKTAVKSDKNLFNNSIFSTDSVSDFFFRDVTNNLSVNINKSLLTIQQTSSNVKEIIKNSIPTNDPESSDTFSYDDTSSDLNYVPSSNPVVLQSKFNVSDDLNSNFSNCQSEIKEKEELEFENSDTEKESANQSEKSNMLLTSEPDDEKTIDKKLENLVNDIVKIGNNSLKNKIVDVKASENETINKMKTCKLDEINDDDSINDTVEEKQYLKETSMKFLNDLQSNLKKTENSDIEFIKSNSSENDTSVVL